jgi:hypothetical protein
MTDLNIPNDGVQAYVQQGNRSLMKAGAGIALAVGAGLAYVGLGDVDAKRKANDTFKTHISNSRDTLYNNPDYATHLKNNRALTRESEALERQRQSLEESLTGRPSDKSTKPTHQDGTTPVKPTPVLPGPSGGTQPPTDSKNNATFPPAPFKKPSQNTPPYTDTQTQEGTRLPAFKDWRSYYGYGVPARQSSQTSQTSQTEVASTKSVSGRPLHATGTPLKASKS